MKPILVTGAYGFIGSNFVKYLNSIGIVNIVVSDYLDNGKQFINLKGAKFIEFMHPDYLVQMDTTSFKQFSKVFHFGAISNTTCWDGDLMMRRNYQFTVDIGVKCLSVEVPFSYSSSASVYGNGDGPMNVYAYSKLLIDDFFADSEVQGFRYFNVYSKNGSEWHKGDQASPYHKFQKQADELGVISVFEGSENFVRDFVDVSKVCQLQWEMSYKNRYGVFDLGTGMTKSFMDVAHEVQSENVGCRIQTIPFPDTLRGCYQTFTCADMSWIKD